MAEVRQRIESSLRARKRVETERHIVSAAIEIFRERGVRAAHIREIARASDVSQATLFNYFPNKGALAEAWVRGEIEKTFEDVAAELEARGLRGALRTFCRRLADRASAPDDREVRAEAWREVGRATRQERPASHPLVSALGRWQESERVRHDVSAATMAAMLTETIEGGLIEGLDQQANARELTAVLRARVDLILDGARKRNERVTAPGRPASAEGWTTRPVQSR